MTNQSSIRASLLPFLFVMVLAGCDALKNADERVDNAERLIDRGAYNEATVELRNALDDDPNNARALIALAHANLQLGLLGEADTAIATAVDAGAPAAEVDPLRVRLLQARGQHQDALARLDDEGLAIPVLARKELRIRSLVATNQCAVALPEARARLAADKNDSTARLAIAECLARRGNVAGAVREIDAAISADPKDAQAWLALGRVRRATGDREGAEAAWLEATRVADGRISVPQLATAFASLADLQVERGDLDAVRATHKALVKVAPESLLAELILAHIGMLEGKPEAAVATLQRLMVRNPQFEGARAQLVSALVAQGTLEQARSQLRDIQQPVPNANLKIAGELLRSLDPADSSKEGYWARVAALQTALGQPANARLALLRAIELAPDSKDAALTLARLDLRLGATKRALDRLADLVEKHPDDSEVVIAHAMALSAAGEHAEAARSLASAQAKAPTAGGALVLHQARQAAGLPDANVPLEQWLARNPDDANVRMSYAEALRLAGDTRGAAAQLEQVVRRQPENVSAQNNLAWVYYLARDPRALETARRARELAPKAIAVADTYGWLLVESGQVEAGLALLREADGSAGGAEPDVRYHLAAALARSGDKDQARALLDDILTNAGDFPSREEAARLRDSLRGT